MGGTEGEEDGWIEKSSPWGTRLHQRNDLAWDGPVRSGLRSLGLLSLPTQEGLARGRKLGREDEWSV